MLIHLSKLEEFDAITGKGDVLVDFFATWCGPCRMLGPVLEDVAKENEDLTILKIDVDEFPTIAAKFGVASIPTLIHFKDGKNVNTALGFMPKAKLLEFLGR